MKKFASLFLRNLFDSQFRLTHITNGYFYIKSEMQGLIWYNFRKLFQIT